ncbi:MAG: hypothetical protein Kow00111_05010 [Thermincola ferriacetica]
MTSKIKVGEKPGKFSKNDFIINFESQVSRSPAGETTSKTYKNKDGIVAYFFPG